MKKKSTLLVLILLTSFYVFSQNFNVLATDPAGDPTQSVNDVERFSIAIDTQKDSLWFKLDFHQTLSGDLGFAFGLDTDQDPNTGTHAWTGIQTGLNCDQIIIINRNFIAPNTRYGSSSITSLNHEWIQPDDTSLIVSMQLSKVDSDGAFNLVMGSGGFDMSLTNRRIFDEIPTTGWVVVSPATSNEPLLSHQDILVFPQPAKDVVHLEFAQSAAFSKATVSILSLDGKVIIKQSPLNMKQRIDLSKVPSGIYFMQFRTEDTILSRKLIVE